MSIQAEAEDPLNWINLDVVVDGTTRTRCYLIQSNPRLKQICIQEEGHAIPNDMSKPVASTVFRQHPLREQSVGTQRVVSKRKSSLRQVVQHKVPPDNLAAQNVARRKRAYQKRPSL